MTISIILFNFFETCKMCFSNLFYNRGSTVLRIQSETFRMIFSLCSNLIDSIFPTFALDLVQIEIKLSRLIWNGGSICF
jgi:hypothetical protein